MYRAELDVNAFLVDDDAGGHAIEANGMPVRLAAQSNTVTLGSSAMPESEFEASIQSILTNSIGGASSSGDVRISNTPPWISISSASSGLDSGTYYVLEKSAPVGYVKDDKVCSVELLSLADFVTAEREEHRNESVLGQQNQDQPPPRELTTATPPLSGLSTVPCSF